MFEQFKADWAALVANKALHKIVGILLVAAVLVGAFMANS